MAIELKTNAFFSPCWPASAGASGIASYVDAMVQTMPELGWNCEVVTWDHKGNQKTISNGLRIHSVLRESSLERLNRRAFGKGGDKASLVARTFAQLARKHAIDVIEMEESFGFCRSVIESVRIPVIVRLHGPWFLTGAIGHDSNDPTFQKRVRMEGEGIRAAAGVTAPSRFVLDAVRQYYKIPLEHAEVIPNPVSQRCVVFPDLETQIPKNAPVILYVGRFEPLKGGDLAIEAFAILARKFPDFHFVFIGPDHGEQSTLKVNAIQYAANQFRPYDLNRFHFLGRQEPKLVDAWRQRATIIAVTSRFENFPLALLEAMNSERPVVATAVGGIPEIVRDEENGLLVTPDPSAIASGLERLIEDRGFANRLAYHANIDVEKNFSARSVGNQTVDYYERIIRKTSG